VPRALRSGPRRPTPIADVPEVFDFPRDIQPILDRHCIRCHDYGRRDGNVILAGDRGPMFSHSYYTLTYLRQFVDGRNDPKSNLPPRAIGAAASPLMKKIAGDHYDVRLTPHETRMIRYWIESGAPYPGTYAALGSGMIGGYYENQQVNTDRDWPAAQSAGAAIQRRCGSCHAGDRVLPRSLSDERDVSFWRPDPGDPRLRLSRHLAFNLTRPEKSLMLLAPLASEAGGHGVCRPRHDGATPEGSAVFSGTEDPDYQKILALCRTGKEHLEEIGRFDMPGFRPPGPYVREMKRYGVLPADLPAGTALDVYQTDRAYWQSLWYHPPAGPVPVPVTAWRDGSAHGDRAAPDDE
jgi:hypothetical protein